MLKFLVISQYLSKLNAHISIFINCELLLHSSKEVFCLSVCVFHLIALTFKLKVFGILEVLIFGRLFSSYELLYLLSLSLHFK